MAKSISVTVAVSQLPLVNCLLIGFKKADWKKGMGVTYTCNFNGIYFEEKWVGTYTGTMLGYI